MLCLVALFVSQTSKAQWVVTDPGNLAQGIINATKNIVHTSSTASTMIKSFQETVKIYEQGKEYYDALKKVKNLVKDARKVHVGLAPAVFSDDHVDAGGKIKAATHVVAEIGKF